MPFIQAVGEGFELHEIATPLMLHSFYIISNMEALSARFAERLTPPFAEEDASSDAEKSVLHNVNMAFRNRDQIPIPCGTSAEAGVVHVLKNVLRGMSIGDRDTEFRFEGANDLRPGWTVSQGEHLNPLLLIEAENDFGVRAYELRSDEVFDYFEDRGRTELADVIASGLGVVIAVWDRTA